MKEKSPLRNATTKITHVSELLDKDFKVAMIKMFQ